MAQTCKAFSLASRNYPMAKNVTILEIPNVKSKITICINKA